MFGFFRRFIEFELKLKEFEVTLDALKDSLDEARSERDEFKEILFRKFGLVEQSREISGEPVPIMKHQSMHRVLRNLEQKDREEYWARKAKEAEEKLKGVSESPKEVNEKLEG